MQSVEGEPLRIKRAGARIWRVPLIQPFRTARGQHRELQNVLLTLEFLDGTRAYGEAAIATHLTGETVTETLKNLKRIARELVGREISSVQNISREFESSLSHNHAALAALEMALLDGITQRQKIPLWKLFGKKSFPLRTDITVVLGSVEESVRFARQAYRLGFRAFKIKIGKNFDLDFQRVSAVYRVIHGSSIYLDANQGFTPAQTIRFLKCLNDKRIRPELIEQPVSRGDWDGLEEVKRKSKVPVIADESVFSVSDAKKLIKKRAADGINVKLMKSGIFGALEISRLAKRAGLKLMIGSMMETPLAATAAAHLAGALGGFDFVDLDPVYFLKSRATKDFHPSANGRYDLGKIKSGIGVVPS